MGGFLRAIGTGLVTYLGIIAAAILAPCLLLMFAVAGTCIFLGVFYLALWLLIRHDPHFLHAAVYTLLWGAVPVIAAAVIGFYQAEWKARRTRQTADAPFFPGVN